MNQLSNEVQRSFLIAQEAELSNLITLTPDHPLMTPPLQNKLETIKEQLIALPSDTTLHHKKLLAAYVSWNQT